jgi:hypothetical protein
MSCAHHHHPKSVTSEPLIDSYASFIALANTQQEPQRLLWVFARAELPNGYTEAQKQHFLQGQGGALEPVLCVDKLPSEVTDFASLVHESAETGVEWDIAFVASMSGRAGIAPNSDEAIQPMRLMLNKIQSGIIAEFLTFDKKGELVSLS